MAKMEYFVNLFFLVSQYVKIKHNIGFVGYLAVRPTLTYDVDTYL